MKIIGISKEVTFRPKNSDNVISGKTYYYTEHFSSEKGQGLISGKFFISSIREKTIDNIPKIGDDVTLYFSRWAALSMSKLTTILRLNKSYRGLKYAPLSLKIKNYKEVIFMQKKFIKLFNIIVDSIKKSVVCLCGLVAKLYAALYALYEEDKRYQAYLAEKNRQQQTIDAMLNFYPILLEVLYDALNACSHTIDAKPPNFPEECALEPYIIPYNNNYVFAARFLYTGYDKNNAAPRVKVILNRELKRICYIRGVAFLVRNRIKVCRQ